MSWQTYVDDHLLCQLPHGGVLSAAAIVGQDGGVWAQNDTFPELVDGEVPSFDLPPRCMHMAVLGQEHASIVFMLACRSPKS